MKVAFFIILLLLLLAAFDYCAVHRKPTSNAEGVAYSVWLLITRGPGHDPYPH